MQTTTFRSYRAIYKIHVGGLDRDIHKDEVVLFDGTSMKVGDKTLDAPTLVAAIKVGWLVPSEQATTDYKPAPAKMQMHKAAPTGPERKPVDKPVLVHDEERDMGHVAAIRGDKAPATHQSKNAAAVHKTANSDQITSTESEGVVVRRFKSPAKHGPLEVGKDDQRVLRDLDPLTGRKLESLVVKTATGDVKEPLVGDTLDALLPEAATSSVPDAGVAGEGIPVDPDTRARNYRDSATRVVVASGSSSIGGIDDDAVVVGKVGAKAEAVVDEAGGGTPTVEVAAEEKVEEVPPAAIIQAKIEMIQQFVPNFTWDMSENWLVRCKKALEYKNNMPVLNAILSLEIPAVRKRVLKSLYGDQ